jgi:hypothetical protein
VSSLLLALLMACSTSAPPASIEDCHGRAASPARDECFAAFLPALFELDPMAAGALTESDIQDPLVRDFVYLQVTRDVDPAGGRWCDRISAPVVAERCRVLARRPHLQRARLGRAQPGEP